VRVLGVCPQEGAIILEYCVKKLGKFEIHMLADVLLHLGKELPLELQLNALVDIAHGLDYMHKQGLVHGDIKPANMLVCRNEENLSWLITHATIWRVHFQNHLAYDS